MRVVVIEPPETVVTAEEAKTARVFADDDDDEYVDLLLAIAQAQIDGPAGWLRRAIGVQTLRASVEPGCEFDISRPPYPPLVEIVSDETVDGLRTVEYIAGYEANEVPKPIKHAIILMAGQLRSAVPSEKGALKTRTVDGVGSWTYSLPDGAADAMQRAADALLSTYRPIA